MGKITWTADLDTGIEPIDVQHRQLIDLVNQLEDARRAGDREIMGSVIDGLIEYTLSHFTFEEALLEEAGYQFLRPHKKLHQLFINRVNELNLRFRQGENVADEIHVLLKRWLLGHIRRDDAAYVVAVKEKMIEITEEKNGSGWLARSLRRFFGRP